MHVGCVRVDIQQTGRDFAFLGQLVHVVHRPTPIGRIVIDMQLAQAHDRAVALGKLQNLSRRRISQHLLGQIDEIDAADCLVMRADMVIAARAARVVVESDAGADHIDEGRPTVHDRALDQGDQLSLVAGKSPAHIGRAQLHRDANKIDRRIIVDQSLLAATAPVGCGRELPFGQTIDAVVFDDINHADTTAHRVSKLTQTNRGRITIARDTQVEQFAIGQIRTGQHAGHAAVHRVETVACAKEIIGRLARASDARQLGHPMRLYIELPDSLNDGRRDRIVAATGAQRRDLAFIVAPGVADSVLCQSGVMQTGLGDKGHLMASLASERCDAAAWRPA